jgi:hypothetical protein
VLSCFVSFFEFFYDDTLGSAFKSPPEPLCTFRTSHLTSLRANPSVAIENYSKCGGSDCVFKANRIEVVNVEETLGELIGTFSSRNAAIDAAAKQGV